MAEHTIFENLQRLKDSKSAIGNAIITKGGTVGATDGLEEFAADIMSIKNDMTSIDITENGTYYSGDETVVTSSTFPVVVSDSNGTPVRHAVINGNVVQNGIPTPENPIYPQETGERAAQLFDKNGEILVGNGSVINILATGIKTIIETAGSNRYSSIKLDNELLGKTITISSTITQSANNKGQIRLFYVNGRYTTSSITAITTAGQTGYITRTYTMPSSIPSGSDGIAIVLSADREGNGEVGDYVEYADLMIVEGSTAPTSYIPYGIKIPISSANTTTSIYLGEVPTTRKVKKFVLDGTESWRATGGRMYLDALSEDYIRASGVITCICTHYSAQEQVGSASRVNKGCITLGSDPANQRLYIYDTNISTVTDFKSYLQQQYAAGTPVTVWYVLATPTTGIVNEPIRKIGDYVDSLSADVELPLLQNTKNNIDVNTALKPSSASFTYNKLSEYIGYNEINVDVSNTYTAEDEGKVVNNATLVSQTARSAEITVNNTYDTTLYNSIVVNVPSAPTPTPSVESNVAFYDYDGTIVQSYSANDFANLSELPTNPTHEGLIAQGWNWSLADAKAYVANYGSLNIGQMYTTSDGKTRLYISLSDGRTSPILQLYLNDNSELDIDWGDGSTHSTFTATSSEYKSERHEYSTSGDYVIAITVVSGGFELQSSSTNVSSILWNGNNQLNSPDKAYNNAIKKIEIGDGVTSIGNSVFYNCSSLSLITIPDNVTSIGDNAFDTCSSLSSITIPDAVTSIGTASFNNCYSLSSVTIPDSVATINDSAFYNCYSLLSMTIPNGVTSIGVSVFSTCSSLSSITIPDGVTSIGVSAFDSCSSLPSVAIPDSVTTIGASAFYNCSSLSSITIPNSVTSIGNTVFSGCSSLSLVTISDKVTSIGMHAFSSCKSLSSIIIPDGVTTIGMHAFSSCPSLSSVTIPDSVTSIGAYAFNNCSSLLSITIPNSVTSISNYTFQNCYSLSSVTISDKVTSIGMNAFADCSSLSLITIPDSVTSIGMDAFSGCSSLPSITIPDSVTSISTQAFSNCSSLSSVTIPDSVTSISGNIFSGCSSLSSITIPDTVTSIGASAFSNCAYMSYIKFEPTTPPTVSNANAWTGLSTSTKILVPSGTLATYKSASKYPNPSTYTYEEY